MAIRTNVSRRGIVNRQLTARPDRFRAIPDFRWRGGSSGGFGFAGDLNSVTECYAFDDFRQLILSFQPTPAFRRRQRA